MVAWPRTVFYGWWVVGSAVAVQGLLSGLIAQGYGVYIVAWQAEFGWSKTALASAYALMQAMAGVLGPAQGWLLKRFGARNIVRLGTILAGLGMIAVSRVDGLVGFYAAFSLVAVGLAFGGFLSLSTAVVAWFSRRRAMALALTQTGLSIGGFFVPLVAWMLLTVGWRNTAWISGLVLIAVALLAGMVMRNRPSDVGEIPDGRDLRPVAAQTGAGSTAPDPVAAPEFTTRQALRTRAFWLLALGHGVALFVVSAILVHLVVFLHEEAGYSVAAASIMLALMTGFSIAGQLIGGYFGDRFDKRMLAGSAMLVHGLAMLVLALSTSWIWVVLFAVLQGSAWGVRGPLMLALRADWFGVESYATVMGISSLFVMGGMTLGPVLAGAIADATGSYVPAFFVLSAAAALGSACFFFSAPPAAPAPARS